MRRLLLLLRVRRRSEAALGHLAGQDGANDCVVTRVADLRRRLGRSDVLGRRVHGARRTSAVLQLAAQHVDFFFVPGGARVRVVKGAFDGATHFCLRPIWACSIW